MNVSPEKNIEGANTEIAVMAIAPITNKLDKDQKNGDATKIKASGELEIVRADVPVIDSKTENHIVNSDGKRQLPTGEIMKISANKDRRKLHKSILAEQAQQRGLEQILCPWLIFFPSDYIISIYEIIRQLIESIFFFICGYFVYDDIKDNKYQAFNVSFLL